MNKNPFFKWFFSFLGGVIITSLLFLLEMKYPLKFLTDAPRNASWLDGVIFYWIYFVIYNGYFYLKTSIKFFRSQSVKTSDSGPLS